MRTLCLPVLASSHTVGDWWFEKVSTFSPDEICLDKENLQHPYKTDKGISPASKQLKWKETPRENML